MTLKNNNKTELEILKIVESVFSEPDFVLKSDNLKSLLIILNQSSLLFDCKVIITLNYKLSNNSERVTSKTLH